jgi:hypothetical protein
MYKCCCAISAQLKRATAIRTQQQRVKKKSKHIQLDTPALELNKTWDTLVEMVRPEETEGSNSWHFCKGGQGKLSPVLYTGDNTVVKEYLLLICTLRTRVHEASRRRGGCLYWGCKFRIKGRIWDHQKMCVCNKDGE